MELYKLENKVVFNVKVTPVKAESSEMNIRRCMRHRIKNICTPHYTWCNERAKRAFINHTGCSLLHTGCPLIEPPVFNKMVDGGRMLIKRFKIEIRKDYARFFGKRVVRW